jgi:hypothetical protein
MKNKYLTPAPLIITAIAVVALTIILIHASHSTEPFVPSHPVVTSQAVPTDDAIPVPAAATPTAAASVCYILNKPTSDGGRDIAYLKATSSDGTNVTGELGTALEGKDALSGTFVGTLSSNSDGSVTLDAQYSATGEGMNNIVEQKILLTQSQAQVGYGAMKLNSDGTYVYSDPSAITYSLTLPSVDCTEYDSLKAATETK